MPHLYLPSDHSDADLVLAADVATAIASGDLYVAWTHEAGAGVAPEVEALVRDQGAPRPARPSPGLLVVLVQGIVAVWRQLMGPPQRRTPAPQAAAGAHRRAAGRPSL